MALGAFLASAGEVCRADFEKGLSAFEKNDFTTALREWTVAAEQGGAMAQYNLGWMYYHGQGVPQEYETALKWYTGAAKQGVAQAQNSLGSLYHNGLGVSQDYGTALRWYTIAARQGHGLAQYNLGWMHYHGQGVTQSDVKAHMWANLASSNGAQEGAKLKEEAAERLTASQLVRAQRIALACVKNNYRSC